jgi:N-acetyl sugar amidotransferase
MVLSTQDNNYKQCSLSVMDNIADADITFDENGVCNYYHQYVDIVKNEMIADKEEKSKALNDIIEKLKQEGKGKPYDCITGISGGVDSSYLIYLAKEYGLRCLIVHFDNGWNTEIAVNNINKIIQKTGYELYTIVVNWEEFRDLQKSYIKSGVVDLEVPTDHAIAATWYKLAKQYNVKNILSGNNISTEAIMPNSWIYNKSDSTNLRNIHKKFGTIPLKSFPSIGFKEEYMQSFMGGVNVYKLLNYIDYNKSEAKKTIAKQFDWVDYGGKHFESIYTKFFQAYILLTKFNIDKRKPHLSNLIFSGQITKEEAIVELRKPLYDAKELEQDKEYVVKKLGLSITEFDELMQTPPVSHQFYGVHNGIAQRYPIVKVVKPLLKFLKK